MQNENQCDGCVYGDRVEDSLHYREGKTTPYMSCTKDRYEPTQNTPSNSEASTPEWEKEFDGTFYEGQSNSVFCKKHHIFATPSELKSFISNQIALAKEEGKRDGEKNKKQKYER